VRLAGVYDTRAPNPPAPPAEESRADLALSGAAAPETVAVGGTVTYTLTAGNRGPATATGVTLVDRLPGELTFLSASTGGGSCANRQGTVECSLASLAANGSTTVTIRATVARRPAGGTLENTVSVTGREIDPEVGNNTVVLRAVVPGSGTAAVRLDLTGLAPVSPVGVAQTVVVTARDGTGAVATEYLGTVRFTSTDGAATLPADYTFVAADRGVHAFTAVTVPPASGGVTLRTAGTQTVTVTDRSTSSITGSQTVAVGGGGGGGGAAAMLVTVLPPIVVIGDSPSVAVFIVDGSGLPATGYTGTVHFTSSDGAASLPADYTFTAGDGGTKTLPGLVMRTEGLHTVTVTDTANSSISGAGFVLVFPPFAAARQNALGAAPGRRPSEAGSSRPPR
jgi:uncharacterized repeat protein (TIGR01451 family)